jgi:hypothetical protein
MNKGARGNNDEMRLDNTSFLSSGTEYHEKPGDHDCKMSKRSLATPLFLKCSKMWQ